MHIEIPSQEMPTQSLHVHGGILKMPYRNPFGFLLTVENSKKKQVNIEVPRQAVQIQNLHVSFGTDQ